MEIYIQPIYLIVFKDLFWCVGGAQVAHILHNQTCINVKDQAYIQLPTGMHDIGWLVVGLKTN